MAVGDGVGRGGGGPAGQGQEERDDVQERGCGCDGVSAAGGVWFEEVVGRARDRVGGGHEGAGLCEFSSSSFWTAARGCDAELLGDGNARLMKIL